MTSHPISRRSLLAAAGGAAGAVVLAGSQPGTQTPSPGGWTAPGRRTDGYVPDGVAGAFPPTAVRLLDGPFKDNQSRNSNYLHFVDPDRLLHTFRLNVDLPSAAQPCGGWEAPDSLVRGHTTGHLLTALALTHAGAGDRAAARKGRYIVDQLARCQAQSPSVGFHAGYLSAFPEYFFDRLEDSQPVWAPYYMIHKIMAGLIDQYELAGNARALNVAVRLADWVDWRTARLSYSQMQRVLEVEYGGIAETLANVSRLTGEEKYLRAAQRFDHERIFDPLARGADELAGLHANSTVPKMISCIRLWEETGNPRYHDVGANFWRIVTEHHSYIIGGSSNHEHYQARDAIAGQLSNSTCENCVSYNMLKLTRLMHFHQPERIDLLDYYERTLFNQMLGEQDPDSAHGFNIYYTGLSSGAFKQQPTNYFPDADPNAYSTDYDSFTCDHATGMETPAKFTDTIYTHNADGLFVNLFIPSEVTWAGLRLRQTTGFPDEPATHLEVVSGHATMTLRIRVPSWVAEAPQVRHNNRTVPATASGDWTVLHRHWHAGDRIDVTLPMRLTLNPAPDDPTVQAVTYGPIVLAGAYGNHIATTMPRLDTTTLQLASEQPLTFQAQADSETVTLTPLARTHHQHYTVYWQT